MNLLFCINKNFISLWQVCMTSIFTNGGAEHYNVYVFHSDLSEKDQAEMRQFAGTDADCSFISVPEKMFENFPESDRYPKQIYYRLAAPLLLPREVDRILYLDVDLVVINSLAALYDKEFGSNLYLACSHTNEFLDKFNEVRLESEKGSPYINSGVLLMNLTVLRQEFNLKVISDYANRKKYALMLPDQDILSALYGSRIGLLDTMIYNLNDRILNFYNADPANEKRNQEWVKENSVIIHYFGKNKPWKPNFHGKLGGFYHQASAMEQERSKSCKTTDPKDKQ